jgi:hypothetical protein
MSKSDSRFGAGEKAYERIPAKEVEIATLAQINTVLAVYRLGSVWEQLH